MPRRCTAFATFLLALVLSGCGFSGALYLPEDTPTAPAEEPQDTASDATAATEHSNKHSNFRSSPALPHGPDGNL